MIKSEITYNKPNKYKEKHGAQSEGSLTTASEAIKHGINKLNDEVMPLMRMQSARLVEQSTHKAKPKSKGPTKK